MIEIKNLNIIIGTREIIKDLSFCLQKGDKMAMIGEEGNGKSTLIKAILGACHYAKVTGEINFNGSKLGYLKQILEDNEINKSVYDFLFKDENDYYLKIKDFYRWLSKLNIDDSFLNNKLKDLSGGEKIKISILKLLLDEYDVLFLDEPSNDLDIATLKWLEDFIKNQTMPIVYVSHDEELLSNTANMILHIEQLKRKNESKVTVAKSSYEDYVKNKISLINKQNQISNFEKKEHEKTKQKLLSLMQTVHYQQNAISRKDPHGARLLKKKMHALKSQEKRLENKEITEKADFEEGINFFFENVFIPKNKNILSMSLEELKVENKILARNVKLEVKGKEHVCITGKNGSGKTTLIRLIYDELKSRNDIKIGYMPQNYNEILKEYNTPLDFLVNSGKKEDVTLAMTFLGGMNFTHQEMIGNISNLSGGSQAKLFIVKMIIEKCNVLLLDEPTRNLSPLSNPTLRKMLKKFSGTIISISHDRKYIKEVADTIYVLSKEGLIKSDKDATC